ncbi:antirestriction protein ArdA [Flexibacterium corallicola]|uniref:antirestriction protein ArdA n=1 Tax=Flexibacterium corallicola TaxID=3037259 RepID=UPI00286F355B|nr:antirestriction protein ArdA [Pseudovibrio sp. M1P-2-3]
MTIFYAQPYDISATGFFFETSEQFQERSSANRNDYGDPVEEYEIQFITGEDIDYELSQAWGINQANIAQFIEAEETWDDFDKIKFIIAVGECGCTFDPNTADADDYDVDIYHVDNLKELAEQFVDEGLFSEIPERIQYYLDFDLIARDLEADYTATIIAGERLAYRCG